MEKPNQATGAGWNSGVAVGQKWAFTVAETLKLSRHLAQQSNWHDLALLSLGNDSLLRAEDLLSLTVADVFYSTGKMRDYLGKRQGKTGRNVFPPLLTATKTHVAHWIKSSGKRQHHALFTRTKGDAGIADVNPDQTVEDYRAQGIIDESGTLNWERFNALVSANRSNLYTEANFKANAADFEDEQNDDAPL